MAAYNDDLLSHRLGVTSGGAQHAGDGHLPLREHDIALDLPLLGGAGRPTTPVFRVRRARSDDCGRKPLTSGPGNSDNHTSSTALYGPMRDRERERRLWGSGPPYVAPGAQKGHWSVWRGVWKNRDCRRWRLSHTGSPARSTRRIPVIVAVGFQARKGSGLA